MNLVRDKGTGKSKGFAFIAYEDQRSTNLAVGQSLSLPNTYMISLFYSGIYQLLEREHETGSSIAQSCSLFLLDLQII